MRKHEPGPQGEGKPVRGVGGNNSVSVANAASKGFFLPGFPAVCLSNGICLHNTRKNAEFSQETGVRFRAAVATTYYRCQCINGE